MNLHGKAVLLTGGRRVGGQLAKRLARHGCDIAMTYLSSKPAIESTLAEIGQLGRKTRAIHADLSDPDQAEKAVVTATEAFGKLDILVNMASVYKKTPFASLQPQDFQGMITANLAAPYYTAVAAAKQMKRQAIVDGLQGKIISVGDWATERPYRDYLPYLTSKGALTTFTMALAKELAPTITVNLVQPAMIEPPADFGEAEQAAVLEATPLKRLGQADDLNALIIYLLESTDFATGSCYRVDGGRFLGVDD